MLWCLESLQELQFQPDVHDILPQYTLVAPGSEMEMKAEGLGLFLWLFVLLQIQTSLPAHPLCLLLWTHPYTHIQYTYVNIGLRGCINIHWNWNSDVSHLLGLRQGITWRIIAGDKLPLQTRLHWFGQKVCVRESNSDRSEHFTNGLSTSIWIKHCAWEQHCWEKPLSHRLVASG